MPKPPRPFLTHRFALGYVVLACLLLAFFLSSASTASTSAGATGNDPRAFPRTLHLWGGYPNNYTKYDVVIGYPAWDIASLRAADPGAIFLINAMLDPWNADWQQWKGLAVTYGAANGFTGATDTVVDGSAANLGTIPAWNSYWDTLYHPDGTVAVINSTYGHPGWNLTRTDTAEKIAKIQAYGAKVSKLYRNGWDGVFSDNWIYMIGASWFYGSNLDTNRDGAVDSLSTVQRQWWDGLNLVGQRLREYLPGKIVGGNGSYNIAGLGGGTDPNGPYKASNVTMNEVLELYTTRADTVVSEVQSYLGFSDPYGMPRYFLIMHKLPGGGSDYKSMRWGFSLATIAGGYYEPYATDHDDAFSYDEFTGGSIGKRGWLGQPVSAPTKLANGVWRRDFEHGVVLNNSTSSAQSVSLGGTFQRLKGSQDATVNSGATVTLVTVPAGDGLFLSGTTTTSTAPVNSTTPTISGTAAVGQTLSGSTGSWSGSPTSYAYRWQRCDSAGANCLALSTATSQTYSLTTGDAGSTMRVAVTASSTAGSTTAVSAATGVVTSTSTAFTVTSSIANGATLAGSVSWTASPSGATASKVEFSVDGQLRSTASTAPYGYGGNGAWDTTKETNGSHTLAVKAYATDGRTATASATVTSSNGTAPVSTTTPGISGTAQVGQTLTASTGSWSGSPTSYAYQWLRCDSAGASCAAISGATSQAYALVSGDAGTTARVRVTTTNTFGSASATSAQTAVVTSSTSGASPSLSIASSIREGQPLSGQVRWTASVSGITSSSVSRVEFFVDGKLVWTELLAPYVCNGDNGYLSTTTLSTGWHAFTVKVTTTSGATAVDNERAKIRN